MVSSDQVVAHFFQIREKRSQALLYNSRAREVVAWQAERDRGKAGHRFEEEFEIMVVRLPLAAPCQTLASQQE